MPRTTPAPTLGGRVARAAPIVAAAAPIVAAAIACLEIAIAIAACGPSDRELRSNELRERLVAQGQPITSLIVWEPRGSVPHWVAEAEVSGDRAAAELACTSIAGQTYAGEAVYLVTVAYPGGIVECGWGRP